MKRSQLFTKTQKDISKETASINHQLLVRAGFVDQLQSGVYTFLPMGLKVLRRIENIVREKMIKIGGQEILMPSLQPKLNWEKTGRWKSMDDLFRFTSYYTKIELALGPTHEEVVAPLAKKFVLSYKDLPVYLFQIQTKFRDELRAKSGLLRAREFSMKDLYSFHADEKDLNYYYEKAKRAYYELYDELGIGEKTYLTYASGGTFSKYSHEFQTISRAGEDIIFICDKCNIAINKEIIKEQNKCPQCKQKDFREEKAIEVGNIFKLGTKYSDPFGLKYADKEGKLKPVIMGCYGFGPARVMGTIVEVNHDNDGIIWPKEVSPFDVYLINFPETQKAAEEIYKNLIEKGIDVLWDDRDISPSEKLKDADLIGVPKRLVISKKTLEKESAEFKRRDEEKVSFLKIKSIASYISSML